jgi:hypothetical protein
VHSTSNYYSLLSVENFCNDISQLKISGKKRKAEHDDEMAANPIPILFDVITHHDDGQVLIDLQQFFDDPAD